MLERVPVAGVVVVVVFAVGVVAVSWFWMRLRQRPYRCHIGSVLLRALVTVFSGVGNRGVEVIGLWGVVGGFAVSTEGALLDMLAVSWGCLCLRGGVE